MKKTKAGDATADPIDGHLLRVLRMLVDEKSVTRAAQRLGESQPAISSALKRLRSIFGDPLLVREKLQMVPTTRALQLAADAESALDAMRRLVAPPEAFDALRAERTFRVASPDYMSPAMLATVARRVRIEAPQCHLEVHALGPDFDVEPALAEGRFDVVIGNWPHPPEHLHLSLLLEDELVCLLRNDHPLLAGAGAAGLSEASYLAASHVVPTPYSMSRLGVVETHLSSLGATRVARVFVPYFGLAPYVAAETDLLFTTARHFARPFTKSLPLVMLPAPPDFPCMRFYLLWHEREHQSPAHRWLRGLIAQVGRGLAPVSA